MWLLLLFLLASPVLSCEMTPPSGSITHIAPFSGFQHQTSLQLDQTNCPVFTFGASAGSEGTNVALHVIRCKDPACGTHISTLVDRGPKTNGAFSSLALRDNLPIISYYNFAAADLRIAFCEDLFCEIKSIRTLSGAGRYSSLLLTRSGFPILSYLKWGGGGGTRKG